MIKATRILASAVMFGTFAISSAYGAPLILSDAQMDSVAAGGMMKTEGFVCPVITTEAVTNSPLGFPLGDTGHYTIGGPDVSVPEHATNTLDNGEFGKPGGPHAAPGDTGYTAIWNKAAL